MVLWFVQIYDDVMVLSGELHNQCHNAQCRAWLIFLWFWLDGMPLKLHNIYFYSAFNLIGDNLALGFF